MSSKFFNNKNENKTTNQNSSKTKQRSGAKTTQVKKAGRGK
jgi:hypothetical protein